MFKSIPASNIVAVYPAVLGAGGNPLGLNANILHDNAVYPNYEYFSAVQVGEHYGLESATYKFATVYFNGFKGATTRPASLFITRNNAVARNAQLIGGSVKSVKISTLQEITAGVINVVIDGVQKQATGVDLSTINSFSDVATALSTALTATVQYDSQLQVFLIKSGTTGEGSTVSFATGSVAEALFLTEAKGALVDNDTKADTVNTVTKKALSYSTNFATITYIGDSFNDAKLKELAEWVTAQNVRFHLITYGLDPLAITPNNPASFGAWASEYTSGVTPLYGTLDKAAFFCGVNASINYEVTNGRTTTFARSQDGLIPEVDDEDVADALVSNGYSFYGAWATANDRFKMAGNGSVTGDFKWIDNYMFAIFLNNQIQLAGVQSLMNYTSIPYNQYGLEIRRAVMRDPINQGVNFGGIRAGVTLSEQQKNIIDNDIGVGASNELYAKGWVYYVALPSPQARANREPFIEKLFYTDGSSLQRIELTSTNVQ